MTPQQETLELRGDGAARATTQFCYRRAGQGPPLVWLHWLWGEPGWMDYHQRLAERFEVFVPDLPGYGQSALPEWAKTPHDVAVLLLQFFDALSLERPIVVGSCLGGWVAAELAVLRPERIARLVLISPLGLVQDWTKVPNLFYTDPARLPGYLFTDAVPERASVYVPDLSHWTDAFINNRNASIRLVFDPYLHSRSLRHHLHLLTTPTLVVWGEQDPLLTPAHAGLWTATLPRAHSVTIPRAGHLPYVEECEAVIRVIHTFIPPQEGGGV